MREITTHHIDGKAHNGRVVAMTDGSENMGGMPTRYVAAWAGCGLPDICDGDVMVDVDDGAAAGIAFQSGDPLVELNGVTNEQLLAIIVDRLECAQKGPFACPETERALYDLDHARHSLQVRTRRRIGDGVEGTNKRTDDEDRQRD